MTANKFLSLLILFSNPLFALTLPEQTALDLYVADAKKKSAPASSDSSIEGITTRMNKLEAEVNPLVNICLRGRSMLTDAENWLQILSNGLEKGLFKIRPYDDPHWKAAALKMARDLCCTIKTDPEWQNEIQDRLAQGLPALDGEGPKRVRVPKVPGAPNSGLFEGTRPRDPNVGAGARVNDQRRRGGQGGGQQRRGNGNRNGGGGR